MLINSGILFVSENLIKFCSQESSDVHGNDSDALRFFLTISSKEMKMVRIALILSFGAGCYGGFS